MKTGRYLALALAASILGAIPPTEAAGKDIADLRLDDGAIRRAFGEGHDTYFLPNGSIAAQVIIGLNNPRPTERLPDGNYLYSGCRPHSCDEKAGVVATPAGAILAAGLINYRCAQVKRARDEEPPCDGDPRLTVLVKKLDAGSLALMERLKAWAEGVAEIKTVEMRAVP
jgi:hypothetical protein